MAEPTGIDFSQPFDIGCLNGRSVLITGGASGIGLASATKMAEAGALVTITDIQTDAGNKAAQDLSAKGHKVQFVTCDVTSYEALDQSFRSAIKFGNGKLDVAVANAGVWLEPNLVDMVPKDAPLLDGPSPPEPGYKGMDINLRAVYHTSYLALHYFRLPRPADDTFRPSLVLVASLAAYVGLSSSTTYSMSKFGVRGLFYGIRDQAAASTPSIRVNLLAPCFIKTPLCEDPRFLKTNDYAFADLLGWVPLERVIDALVRLSGDNSIHGRAAGIFPEGISEDMGDDIFGGFDVVTARNFVPLVQRVMQTLAEKQ